MRIALQQFPRHVQRQVRRIDDTLHEPQIPRQQLLALIHDEDTLNIQFQPALLLLIVEAERLIRRDEQQRPKLGLTFNLEVQRLGRRTEVVRDRFVELVVLLLGHLVGHPQPDRLATVDGLFLGFGFAVFLLGGDENHGMLDEIRELFDDTFELPTESRYS